MRMMLMRINKTEKTMSIIKRIIFLLIAALFLLLFFVVLTQEHPSENSLVYEECTFVNYEYVKHESRKSSDMEYYNIYVEEYAEPLKIDNIVFDKANESALSDLEKGNKVTVSIENSNDTLYLYSISSDDIDILSYEAYLEAHTENEKYGIIVCPILAFLGIGLFIAEVIYYKKTGKSLPWPRSI